MKKFILILTILGLAGGAWGANQVATVQTAGTSIKYKTGNASNCADASGWTEGSTLTVALAASGGSGTLYVCPGTYSGTMLAASGGLDVGGANQTIQAVNDVIVDCSAINDSCFKDGSFYGGLSVKGHSVTHPLVVLGRTASTQPAFRIYNGSVQDVEIRGGLRGIQSLVNFTANRLTIKNISGTDSAILIPGTDASAITLNYVRILGTTSTGSEIYATVASAPVTTIAINNLASYASTGTALTVHADSSAVVTMNNSILTGRIVNTTPTINNASTAGGTVTINNSIIHGSGLAQDNYNIIGATVNNSILNKDPKFKSNKYPSAIALVVDDTNNLTWFNNTIKPKLDARGYKATLSINDTKNLSASLATLNALEDAGFEIACHTRRHIRLDTIAAAFTIAKAATTAGLGSGTLTTSTPHSYTLASYTMAQLRTQMQADGYTVGALTSGYDTMPATVLADFAAGTSIASAYPLTMDQTRTWTEEIVNSKQDLITGGLNPQTFIPPGNYTSADLRAYLKDTAGFYGARGDGTVGTLMSSYGVFDVPFRDLNTTIGDYNACVGAGETQANCIKRNTVANLSRISAEGSLYMFYTHGESEWDSDEWDAFLDAIEQSGIQVKTLYGLINYAKTYDPSSDLATEDDLVYTRTLVDMTDMSLLTWSPAIDVGLVVANLHGAQGTHTFATDISDFAGNTNLYGSGVDIGAYEAVQYKPLPGIPGKIWSESVTPKYYTVP